MFLRHLEVSEQQHLIGDLRDRWIPNTFDVSDVATRFSAYMSATFFFFVFVFLNFTAVKSRVWKSS